MPLAKVWRLFPSLSVTPNYLSQNNSHTGNTVKKQNNMVLPKKYDQLGEHTLCKKNCSSKILEFFWHFLLKVVIPVTWGGKG